MDQSDDEMGIDGEDDTIGSSSEIKKIISSEEWKERLAQVKLARNYLNKLVMDYFIVEGHQDAVDSFQEESGTKSSVSSKTIEQRVQIRNLILEGRIQEALEITKELNPELLDISSAREHSQAGSGKLSDEEAVSLLFTLRKQQLVELVRAGQPRRALELAGSTLVPLTHDRPDLLCQLEELMLLMLMPPSSWPSALLKAENGHNRGVGSAPAHAHAPGPAPQGITTTDCFVGDGSGCFPCFGGKRTPPSPVGEGPPHGSKDLGDTMGRLMDLEHRKDAANQLNEAILGSQFDKKEFKLQELLQLLVHTQNSLAERAVFPVIEGWS